MVTLIFLIKTFHRISAHFPYINPTPHPRRLMPLLSQSSHQETRKKKKKKKKQDHRIPCTHLFLSRRTVFSLSLSHTHSHTHPYPPNRTTNRFCHHNLFSTLQVLAFEAGRKYKIRVNTISAGTMTFPPSSEKNVMIFHLWGRFSYTHFNDQSEPFLWKNESRPSEESCCKSNWIYWHDDRLLNSQCSLAKGTVCRCFSLRNYLLVPTFEHLVSSDSTD